MQTVAPVLPDISVQYRERTEASNFNAALSEHVQYLRRKKEAIERRQAYESTADDSEAAGASTQSELSLKPGETITLKLAKVSMHLWACLITIWSAAVTVVACGLGELLLQVLTDCTQLDEPPATHPMDTHGTIT